ncbi:hypothetical protein CN923_15120 [Bacillus cereus]|nr:hypothetical protein CON44_11330 [Bacillus cereus]PEB80572.1 hypothetical protein COM95_15630 [Bacillus cereus]PEQ42908.1 hypothetical protein CN467_03555 [Bacillus cereus]PER33828.1 hypothetical protein CN485_11125 [Bacillus cereus]PEW96284.1 hypothetical protein CN446_17135 [Bacillus cereus]
MLFAHIIAQKRKKQSKKYSNVKNCVKIDVIGMGIKSVEMLQVYGVNSEKTCTKNVHVTYKTILPLVL